MQEVRLRNSILVLLLAFSFAQLCAQSKNPQTYTPISLKPRLNINAKISSSQSTFQIRKLDNLSRNYVNQLPIFCKIEHNMSKKARLPVRMRLGSVDYVDYLEGKSKK